MYRPDEICDSCKKSTMFLYLRISDNKIEHICRTCYGICHHDFAVSYKDGVALYSCRLCPLVTESPRYPLTQLLEEHINEMDSSEAQERL